MIRATQVINFSPPFGVGVVNLHGSAAVKRVNVVGPRGIRTHLINDIEVINNNHFKHLAHGIFGQAEDGVQVLSESLLDGGVKGAQNSRRAAAITLHAGHGSLACNQQLSVLLLIMYY